MDSQWLKAQFALNPTLSKAELARVLGLEPPAVSKILSGGRQIKASEYLIMRRFFGLPVDGEKSLSGTSEIIQPLNSQGSLREASHEGQWAIPQNVLKSRTNSSSKDIRIFKVEEKTMEPDFKFGEHVLVDQLDKKPSPAGAFIVSDGFGYMIRFCEYLPHSSPPRIKISAKDPSFFSQTLDEADFKIIGRIIAKLEWL